MLIWGSRGGVVDLEHAKNDYCPVCERERPFHYLLYYRYFHLYWFFGAITHQELMLLCEVCNRGHKLNSAEAKQQIGRIQIPFMRQYGLLLLGVGVAALAMVISGSAAGFLVLIVVVIAVMSFLLLKRQTTLKS